MKMTLEQVAEAKAHAQRKAADLRLAAAVIKEHSPGGLSATGGLLTEAADTIGILLRAVADLEAA